MQERVERWLSYWITKPMSWVIFWLWLALKHSWLGAMWCVTKLRERWTAWRAKRAINGSAQVPFVALKRPNKREAAQK